VWILVVLRHLAHPVWRHVTLEASALSRLGLFLEQRGGSTLGLDQRLAFVVVVDAFRFLVKVEGGVLAARW
jgi:hypothetical protein